MTQIVRQLPLGKMDCLLNSMPLLMKFMADYERIQSDIFDHLLAVVPEFDLKIYQKPSGYDSVADLMCLALLF